jgi:hypothetical protein
MPKNHHRRRPLFFHGSCPQDSTRINHCYDSANSGCFVERGRCDRRCTQHAKIPSGSSLTSDTYECKMLVLSGVFNTRFVDTMNYTTQDYVHVNYTLIVIYSMLLVTGSQSKNISCFCLSTPKTRKIK